jgi:hypothetical protein
MDQLETIGELYYQRRQAIMQFCQEGLTQTYNRFHDATETGAGIVEMRHLHVEMDQAVAAAYGWQDLNFGHGFHVTRQGLRYTVSKTARREVLDRLLALNHKRHTEEEAEKITLTGNVKSSAKRGRETKTDGDNATPSLNFFDPREAKS